MSEKFSLSWDNFHQNISLGISSLLENEDFIDVTLAVEGRYLKAHKMVLSLCSTYFRDLFRTSPCKHPIVFMKDVSYDIMNNLLQFMYQGEVQVTQDNLNTFIKTAESLQIRGLSNYAKDSTDNNNQSQNNANTFVEPKTPETNGIEDQLIKLKAEPCDDKQSFNENYSDDFMEESNFDNVGEDYWTLEDSDEPVQAGANVEGTIEEESNSSDIEESASSCQLSSISERSLSYYEATFSRFEQWCGENDVKTINENVLIRYLKEKSATYNANSLWAVYAQLKRMLYVKKNINISNYKNLKIFMKRKYQKRVFTKSVVFNREDFENFLKTADDYTFLMTKVVMIIGIAGGCSREDFISLHVENVEDGEHFMRFRVPDCKTNNSRDFIVTAGNIKDVNLLDIIRSYINLRPPNTDHSRFFISYRHGKCTKQVVGKNTFGAMPKNVAQFLGLENPEQFTAHCFRRNSVMLKECVTWLGQKTDK